MSLAAWRTKLLYVGPDVEHGVSYRCRLITIAIKYIVVTQEHRTDRQTDRQTDGSQHCLMSPTWTQMGIFNSKLSKYQICISIRNYYIEFNQGLNNDKSRQIAYSSRYCCISAMVWPVVTKFAKNSGTLGKCRHVRIFSGPG